MTIPSTTVPAVFQTTGRALRTLLVTAAILVLVGASFVIGRVTVTSSPGSATSPASNIAPPAHDSCHEFGHFRSGGC
jgi:hypothetical protein